MSMYGRALVVGKFYPPHRGHHQLIDVAETASENVVVCVLAGSQESIPMELRAAWLRARHPRCDVRTAIDDHPIDYDDHAVYDLHDAVIRSIVPERIDVVVSAERYGEVMATRYGCSHLTIERDDISGTAVRENPARWWTDLQPEVRAYLAKRVAIVGAESTGTTTLAEALAEHYGTACVPEYGRLVSEERLAAGIFGTWAHDDFHAIAQEQQRAEDAVARESGPVLICDTDALATCIWEERYLGASTPATEHLAATRSYDLYIHTLDDIPFVQDGLRDGEHIRHRMTERFRQRLDERSEPVLEVSGPHEARLRSAVKRIDSVLTWDFAAPLESGSRFAL